MEYGNIKEALEEIVKDVREIILFILSSEVAVNNKTPNRWVHHPVSLEDSHIAQDLQVKKGDIGIVEFFLNEEIKWVESGRRAGARRPPIDALVGWATEHNIDTDNKTLWAISTAIARDGISPRPILSNIWDMVDGYWSDDWADRLFNDIIKELDEYFNNG